FGNYFEPFLGSGAILGTLAPENGIGSDNFGPLIEIWRTLRENPKKLTRWYSERWHQMMAGDKVKEYERIKAAYNANTNESDLLLLCRSYYGGVVRFRKADGYMSTPYRIHAPISPTKFSDRVSICYRITLSTE